MPQPKSLGFVLGIPILLISLLAGGGVGVYLLGVLDGTPEDAPHVVEHDALEHGAPNADPDIEHVSSSGLGGFAAVVYVPENLAPLIRAGDTMDVYVRSEGAPFAFTQIENQVFVVPDTEGRNAELQGSLDRALPLPGLVLVRVWLYPSQQQLNVLSALADNRILGLSWPASTVEFSGHAPLEHMFKGAGICFREYIVNGRKREAQVICGERTPADHPMQPLVDKLKAADLAFNRPSEMTVGEVVSIELVLSPEKASGLASLPAQASLADKAEAVGLSPNLEGETQVVPEVRYAAQMQAELSGIDFEISPKGPQARTVLPDQAVKWVWTVKPKAPGEAQILTLAINALVTADGADLPPIEIRTFTERFPVRITFWGRLVLISGELKVVHGAIAAVGGTLAAVGVWLLKRRRKPAAKAPLEVVITHRGDG